MKRIGRHRREKGEIRESPVAPRDAPPCDPPSLELLTAREHMKRGTMDEQGWTDEPTQPRRTAAEGQPPTKKKRLRCFNKEGSVVFIRPGELHGRESVESRHIALVVVGKRMGRAPIPGGSPRYVIAKPLAGGGDPEEWHISQLESSSERMPSLYRAFKEAEEPQRGKLRGLIERVIQELHRRSTVPIEETFEQLVPGGVWSEVVLQNPK